MTRFGHAALVVAVAGRYLSPVSLRILPAGFIAPCLPTKAPTPPTGALCLHEIKHDGFARTAGNAEPQDQVSWLLLADSWLRLLRDRIAVCLRNSSVLTVLADDRFPSSVAGKQRVVDAPRINSYTAILECRVPGRLRIRDLV